MRLDEYEKNYINYITADTIVHVNGTTGAPTYIYNFEDKHKYDVVEICMFDGKDGLLMVDNATPEEESESNAVDHPSHYQGKIEVIDFIEDKDLNFNLGNAVKYIARAGKKDKGKYYEDLKKAIWYLEREVGKND